MNPGFAAWSRFWLPSHTAQNLRNTEPKKRRRIAGQKFRILLFFSMNAFDQLCFQPNLSGSLAAVEKTDVSSLSHLRRSVLQIVHPWLT